MLLIIKTSVFCLHTCFYYAYFYNMKNNFLQFETSQNDFLKVEKNSSEYLGIHGDQGILSMDCL